MTAGYSPVHWLCRCLVAPGGRGAERCCLALVPPGSHPPAPFGTFSLVLPSARQYCSTAPASTISAALSGAFCGALAGTGAAQCRRVPLPGSTTRHCWHRVPPGARQHWALACTGKNLPFGAGRQAAPCSALDKSQMLPEAGGSRGVARPSAPLPRCMRLRSTPSADGLEPLLSGAAVAAAGKREICGTCAPCCVALCRSAVLVHSPPPKYLGSSPHCGSLRCGCLCPGRS